ncbi:unnamed protein product [Cylicostephanus goldi]|uniref:Vitellogenin domain-containing protein n=1 Tax=Cylicostephanus goldi TaxID=71465 RepID=A0A3P6QM99_CYLGO|nr:unnamed protein product [Cylicostephanus goldi]
MDSQLFAITLALLCLTVSEAKVTEVTVLKYDGLEGYHFHSVGQLKKLYTFQFCLCPRNVELQLNPSERHSCQCSPNIRGKSIVESYPHAVYSSACVHKADSENCFKTTFNQGTNERLFVRLGVEEDTISEPEWQELSVKAENTYPIQIATGGSIKLTYSASQTDTDSSAEPFDSRSEERKEAVSEFLTMLSKKGTPMPESHKRVPKAIKSYNVGSIRQLLTESQGDRVNPLSFNVKQFKDEV